MHDECAYGLVFYLLAVPCTIGTVVLTVKARYMEKDIRRLRGK
jgi:hypothetical protein